MSQVKATPLTPFTGSYPHVEGIADWQAASSARLLWDRVHDLEARLQAAEGTAAALVTAHNATDAAQIATASEVQKVQATIAAAGASASLVPAASGGGGGTPPPPNPGDPGSQTNPIIAMSTDPAQIAASVRASLQFYGIGYNPPVDQYWIDKASVPAQFSNGKWYQGWNAYWDARANPASSGSADPNLGGLPSPHG